MKFTVDIQLGDQVKDNADVHHAIARSLLGHWTAFQGHGPFIAGHTALIFDEFHNTVGKWEVIDETACTICGVPAQQHGYYSVTDKTTHQWKSR